MPTFIQHSTGSLSQSNQARTRNKDIQIGKEEEKLSLFTYDTREVINKFSKVTGHKINTQKPITFICTNNKTSEREIKKPILFTTA